MSHGDSRRAAGWRRGLRERRQRRSERPEGVGVEGVDGGSSQLGNGLDNEGRRGLKAATKEKEGPHGTWNPPPPHVPHVIQLLLNLLYSTPTHVTRSAYPFNPAHNRSSVPALIITASLFVSLFLTHSLTYSLTYLLIFLQYSLTPSPSARLIISLPEI